MRNWKGCVESMQDLFEDFVVRYSGPKLAFVVTGGGIGIHGLAQTMGASRLLHVIYVPYSYEESAQFIADGYSTTNQFTGVLKGQEYAEKAVSKNGSQLLAMAGAKHWPECKVIACTAATTTNRYRRGDNQAFVAVAEPGADSDPRKISYHHLPLTKISEEDYTMMGLGYAAWKRRSEDSEITRFLLKLALGEQ